MPCSGQEHPVHENVAFSQSSIKTPNTLVEALVVVWARARARVQLVRWFLRCSRSKRYAVTAERCRGLQGGPLQALGLRHSALARGQMSGAVSGEPSLGRAWPGKLRSNWSTRPGHVRTVRAHLLAAAGQGTQAVGCLTILKAFQPGLAVLHVPLAPGSPCPRVCPQVRAVTAACSGGVKWGLGVPTPECRAASRNLGPSGVLRAAVQRSRRCYSRVRVRARPSAGHSAPDAPGGRRAAWGLPGPALLLCGRWGRGGTEVSGGGLPRVLSMACMCFRSPPGLRSLWRSALGRSRCSCAPGDLAVVACTSVLCL